MFELKKWQNYKMDFHLKLKLKLQNDSFVFPYILFPQVFSSSKPGEKKKQKIWKSFRLKSGWFVWITIWIRSENFRSVILCKMVFLRRKKKTLLRTKLRRWLKSDSNKKCDLRAKNEEWKAKKKWNQYKIKDSMVRTTKIYI